MIRQLTLNHFVLAEQVSLTLNPGLIALTGETGAGKSLMGQALTLVGGGRANASLVRRGEDKARVDLVLELDPKNSVHLDQMLEDLGLPRTESGQLIVRRDLCTEGKSRAWVNGVSVSLRTLKALFQGRIHHIDQGAAVALESADKRLALMDRALPSTRPKDTMAGAALAWRQAQQRLDALKQQLADNQDHLELIRHWVHELDDLSPQDGEWDVLVEQRRTLRAQRDQKAGLARAERLITGAGGFLEHVVELRRIATASESADALHALTHVADDALDEFLKTLQSELSDTQHINEDELNDRMFRWRDLARKNRCGEHELAQRHSALKTELETLNAPEEALGKAEADAASCRAEAEACAQRLTEVRSQAAQRLEKQMNKLLPKLGFMGATLRVEIRRADRLSTTGWDRMDLMLEANPGEGFGPVHAQASGGEKARLLLALDCSLPRRDHLCTVFYDEIDAGMGGRAAQAVARLLQKQSKELQVLVVTHQAAVAAAANQQFRLQKERQGRRTVLDLTELKDTEREAELARMTSGDAAPQAATAVARALLEEGQGRGSV